MCVCFCFFWLHLLRNKLYISDIATIWASYAASDVSMEVKNGRERDKSRTDGRVSGWRPFAFIKSVSRDVDG